MSVRRGALGRALGLVPLDLWIFSKSQHMQRPLWLSLGTLALGRYNLRINLFLTGHSH